MTNPILVRIGAFGSFAAIVLLAIHHQSSPYQQQLHRRNLSGTFDPKTIFSKLSSSSSSSSGVVHEEIDFREISGIRAIVTGNAGGINIIANVLLNAPCVMGAYETGYLLADTPSEIDTLHPSYEWNQLKAPSDRKHPNLSYRLSPKDYEKMRAARNFGELYQLLRHQSPLLSRIDVVDKNCDLERREPYEIIDKSPHYVNPEYLEKVLEKTPMVPVVVLMKSDDLYGRTAASRVNVEKMQEKYPNRIRIYESNDLVARPEIVMKDVMDFVELPFSMDYFDMDPLLEKLAKFPEAMRAEVAPWKFQTAGKKSPLMEQQQPQEGQPQEGQPQEGLSQETQPQETQPQEGLTVEQQ